MKVSDDGVMKFTSLPIIPFRKQLTGQQSERLVLTETVMLQLPEGNFAELSKAPTFIDFMDALESLAHENPTHPTSRAVFCAIALRDSDLKRLEELTQVWNENLGNSPAESNTLNYYKHALVVRHFGIFG